ncbi:uncharacterized protein B0I36DRAFT_324118 [Microdochium trichocladiopsis]|uniref:6-phosphogluconate dehydrogenase NADP-binding domain-containing protein n=1 Tax=Microdochium trichocladiopsis TaxID=1682393 RepID=A0A9P9BR24_9PEZI|nr:uncharacterized protein B0I36DRAFT_324118 [Microdochium trichocladiopsis]KAH7031548.1 hypothetical protein B0I36DRAFT_324118 [Microdochium trichocladiopsis]
MSTTTTTTTAPPPDLPVRLGWIGLGNMGIGMARNIQKHIAAMSATATTTSTATVTTAEMYPPLKVYNRTASRCAGVEELGGVRCESVAQVVQGSDVVFLSLSDDAAVLEMVDQLVNTPPSSSQPEPPHSQSQSQSRPQHNNAPPPLHGKIIIDTTTVHPDTTVAVQQTLAGQGGAQFAAMPVFGPAPVAAAGQLIAAFAGPRHVLDVISPFLGGVIAREVMYVGEEPEKAVLLKTTSNLLTATMTQAIAEAHVFAAKTGLPASTLERLLELNLGPYAHLTSRRMTSGVYCPPAGEAPWSDLSLALKDVGHGVDTARRRGMRLRAGEATLESLRMAARWAEHQQGQQGQEQGQSRRLDSSSLFGAVREENGLEFESEVVKGGMARWGKEGEVVSSLRDVLSVGCAGEILWAWIYRYESFVVVVVAMP